MNRRAASHHSVTRAIRIGQASFFAALGSSLALVVFSYRLPYHDAHNHLVRYTQLAHLLFGPGHDPCAAFLPTLTPYIGLDLVGAALVHLSSPTVAFKAVAALALSGFSLGFLTLVLTAGRARWAAAAVGPALGLGWFFFMGFESYLLGLGLWMGWTAWWLRTRQASPLRHALPLALATIGLGAFHLSAALFAVVVAGADMAATTLAVLRRKEVRTALPVVAARSVLVLAAVGGLWLTLRQGSLQSWSGSETPSTIAQKLARLGSPFVTFSAAQGVVALAPYVVGLAMVAAQVRASLDGIAFHPLTLAAAGMLAAYVIVPTGLNGVAHVDQRFIIPALVLPFALPAASGATSSARGATLTLAAAVAMHLAVLWHITRGIESWFRAADALFAEVPERSDVLAIRPGSLRMGRIEPLGFYDQWLIIDRKARVPGVFSWPGDPHLAHFRQTCNRYDVTWNWRPEDGDLDWARIAREDEYIVQLGLHESTRRVMEGHADLVLLRGSMALFKVRR